MSDISCFAEWEAQQHAHSDAVGDFLSERQQKLFDMASEYRIWADRDSSNDYRSSASEDEESGGVELPVQAAGLGSVGGNATVNGRSTRRTKKGMGLRFKGDGEIPSSTLEESQSLSQKLAREALEEDNHPSSSQPRAASSSIGNVRVGEDNNMEESDDNTDDPLEGFDVLESEKEFLLSLLKIAPTEEVEALNGVTNMSSAEEVRFYVAPAPRSTVEEFARTHPFWSHGQRLDMSKSMDLSELEMPEFKRDVYDYARAAGIGQHQAKVEVMRATAAWRKERGFGVRGVLDEWEEGSDVELELYARSPVLEARHATPLVSSGATNSEPSKKRKRSSFEQAVPRPFSSQVVDPNVTEARRLRKVAKKERKKAARDMKKQMGGKKATVEPNEHAQDQDSVASLPPKRAATGQMTPTEPAKKKKESKLGPTTSAYFAKPQIPDPKQKKEPVTGANSLTDAAKSSDKRKRARKRQRVAGRIGAESEVSHLTSVSTKVAASVEEAVLPAEQYLMPGSFPAVAPVNPILTDLDAAKPLAEVVVEPGGKKHKRKKKRNHNRMPEEQVHDVTGQAETCFSKLKESSAPQDAVKLHAEKRSRTQAFIENLQHASSEDGQGIPSEAREKDGEDVRTEPKRKRTRRKERPREMTPVVLDQSQYSTPIDNEGGISTVPDHHDAEADKPFQTTERQEQIGPSSKKQRQDRGRKSKDQQKEVLELEAAEVQPVFEPLTELHNTNTKQPKEDRRKRGRGRRRESDRHSEMEGDAPLSREQSKVYHS